MKRLTKEDKRYMKELKELIFKLNKGHLILDVVKESVNIDIHISK